MLWWLIFVLCVTLNAANNAYNSRPTENRIVKGTEAEIKDYPYQVSFIVLMGNGSYFCGGFIISEYYILTAAHCTLHATPDNTLARGGSAFRRNGTIIAIEEVITHGEYDKPAFDKDVGILKTVKPMQFSDVMQPVKLPPKGTRLKENTKVDVSGWGLEKHKGDRIPEKLRHVVIDIINHFKCRMLFLSVITDNMWCGSDFFLGLQGTCQGDSGGPAVQDGTAVGIVSFGRVCGMPLSPSVFTDITAPEIRDFIYNKTGL